MPRIILLLAILLGGWIIFQRIKALPAAQRKPAFLKLGLSALIVVVVVLTLTGRMHWLGAAIAGTVVAATRALPILFRLFPALQWLHGRHAAAKSSSGAGGQSQVETALLRMVLDHTSGDLNGEVLDGEYAGQSLDSLDRPQLERLLAYCQQQDLESTRLLESYLHKRFGESFGNTSGPAQTIEMDRREALAILGLADAADREAIIASHRRLMQKLHPDRGGNDYLAAKLNQARDLLLD